MRQVVSETGGVLREGRMLICDRDPKWSRAVEQLLNMAGVRVVQTPLSAPNGNAYAKRFVRSVKNYQGLGNELIDRPATRMIGAVRRRQRGHGILSYYYRSAA